MIVACLIKEIQVSTELRKMAEIELVPKETIDSLINQVRITRREASLS